MIQIVDVFALSNLGGAVRTDADRGMIAIASPLPPVDAVERIVPVAACPAEIDGFAADGRRRLAGAVRSAWACPSFYLAIPGCFVLMIAVLIVRLCAGLGRMFR